MELCHQTVLATHFYLEQFRKTHIYQAMIALKSMYVRHSKQLLLDINSSVDDGWEFFQCSSKGLSQSCVMKNFFLFFFFSKKQFIYSCEEIKQTSIVQIRYNAKTDSLQLFFSDFLFSLSLSKKWLGMTFCVMIKILINLKHSLWW